MKIHYKTVARILTIIFFVIMGLSIAGIFGFNFSIDPFWAFKIWVAVFLVYLIVESFRNRKLVEQRINQYFKEKTEPEKRTQPLLVLTKEFFKYFSLAVCFLGIYYEIFLSQGSSDGLYLAIVIFWLIIAGKVSFNSQISAGVAIFFLILTPIYLISGAEMLAEKTANWAYMFLVACVIQLFKESRKETEDSTSGMNLDKFKRSLLKIGEFIVTIDSEKGN